MALQPLSAFALQKPAGQRMQASLTGLEEDWFNNRRLLEPIGNIPPAEADEAFSANFNTLELVT